MDGGTRAAQALVDSGIEHTITRHGMVRSLEEAAAARGVEPRDIIKTLVVRRGEGNHLFVLVPGFWLGGWAWDGVTPHLEAAGASVRSVTLPGLEDAAAEMRAEGYPAYTTSTGWLGYPEEKVRRLCKEAIAQGWTVEAITGATTKKPHMP